MVALPSTIGEGRYVAAGGQRIRVNVRQGTGVPLVLCNGIGASLEVLDPLVEQMESTVVRFDVPGTGGSPTSPLPYGLPYLAWVLGRVLSKLDIGVEILAVDDVLNEVAESRAHIGLGLPAEFSGGVLDRWQPRRDVRISLAVVIESGNVDQPGIARGGRIFRPREGNFKHHFRQLADGI